MPPRKSIASNPSEEAGAESTGTPVKATKEKVERESVGVEDLSLPKSMIARLAKGVLPANTQIQKDALLALHKSATVFVSYIASNSNELARMGGKKTVSPQDVMSALKDAELEEFLPRLEAELKKYNDVQCDKRNSYRHRVKQEKAAADSTAPAAQGEGESAPQSAAATPSAQLNGTMNGHSGPDDVDRPVKKLKGTDGVVVVTPGEQIDDEDLEDVPPEADDGEDGEEDDEEGEDEEGEDGEEGHADEAMEEAGDEEEEEESRLGNLQDEALDDGDESD